VFNAGVPGWSWVQGLRFFEAYGLDLHPDLVIAAHGTNDQFWPAQVTDRERLPGAGRPAPEMPPASFLERSSVYRFVQQMRRPAGPAGPSPVCRSELARIGTCRRVPLPDIETTIRELADRVRASGAEFVALNADFMETAAAGAARRAVETGRLTFVDFVERLHARQDALDRERAAALGLAAPGPAGARVFGGPKRIVLRVRGDFADGASVSARGAAPFRDDFPFTIALHDDGQAGDEIAGDRVFSGVLEAPVQIGAIEYTFWLDGACEFEPLPPVLSSTGTRLLRFDRDTMGPVADFGDGGLMAERTHPNARGQAVIAEELADLIEELPSFQRWLRAPSS
jgi:lysophospholipase L1-like esterase